MTDFVLNHNKIKLDLMIFIRGYLKSLKFFKKNVM